MFGTFHVTLNPETLNLEQPLRARRQGSRSHELLEDFDDLGFAPRLLSNDACDVNMENASDGQNLEHGTLNRTKGPSRDTG
jgi:hypothetical protein